MPREHQNRQRVLIFLLGSLGDTLVALPALHLVARSFPSAQRRVLSDQGLHPKAVSMASLLEGTGLVHDYYWFPAPAKKASRVAALLTLAHQIRAWKPDILVYLHEQRGHRVALRDAAIFRLLGIRRLIGIPLTPRLQNRVFIERSGRFEHRAEYLARSLSSLGDSRLAERASWDLSLSPPERARAALELVPLSSCPGLVAISIGTKVETNDWGDENWRALLHDISKRLPGWGVIAIGAPIERARSADLLNSWNGPSLNLCGMLSVRESGAVIACAQVFIGHDSGPMHLAAAVGTPCVAIFSARNLPGVWFPFGEQHTIFYNKTECAGCGLDACVELKKKCIATISAADVSAAVIARLSAHATAALNGTHIRLAGQ